ncbi:MAG: hypothetical protein JW850_22055 [Thermoflexales bacterium]|nr:hypothetical protein [Thermoflexales bacterium]
MIPFDYQIKAAQAGWAVDVAAIQARASLDEKPGFSNLSPTPLPRLVLYSAWKDEQTLARSLAGWEAEYARQYPRYTSSRRRSRADRDNR